MYLVYTSQSTKYNFNLKYVTDINHFIFKQWIVPLVFKYLKSRIVKLNKRSSFFAS